MPLTNGVAGRGSTAAVDARGDATALMFDGNAALAVGSERTRTNSSRSCAYCATNVSLTRAYCCSSIVGLDGRDKSPGTRYTFCVPRDGKRPVETRGASSIESTSTATTTPALRTRQALIPHTSLHSKSKPNFQMAAAGCSNKMLLLRRFDTVPVDMRVASAASITRKGCASTQTRHWTCWNIPKKA